LTLITSDPENDVPAAILEYEHDFTLVSVRNADNQSRTRPILLLAISNKLWNNTRTVSNVPAAGGGGFFGGFGTVYAVKCGDRFRGLS
jgi:hypothetical protein